MATRWETVGKTIALLVDVQECLSASLFFDKQPWPRKAFADLSSLRWSTITNLHTMFIPPSVAVALVFDSDSHVSFQPFLPFQQLPKFLAFHQSIPPARRLDGIKTSTHTQDDWKRTFELLDRGFYYFVRYHSINKAGRSSMESKYAEFKANKSKYLALFADDPR
jgi:hypothetical protein